MRHRLPTAAVGAILAGCAPAAAKLPDPTDPAHCIAGYNYFAMLFRKGPDLHQTISVEARMIYAIAELDHAGRLASGKAEALAVAQRHAGDQAAMVALFTACAKAQDADPGFQAAEPDLMHTARLLNKQCQRDRACAVRLESGR